MWIKMPCVFVIVPIQITQRGVKHHRKHSKTHDTLAAFIRSSENRIAAKRKWCKENGIAFVLVRDYEGKRSNKTLAWGDIKALRYAIARLKIRDRP